MNPNWLGVFAAVLSLVAFFLVYRAGKEVSSKVRLTLLVVTALLAIPGASFALYYAHLLPEKGWYFQFRSLRGTEFLLILIGVAGGMSSTFLSKTFRSLPLVGVVVFSFVPFIKPVVGPLSHEELQDRWNQNVCLQSAPSTCGAASTATVARYLGLQVSEAEIAKEAYSYQGGTEAWYLARVLRKRGLLARFDFSQNPPDDENLPAIAGVRLGITGHFIAILERKGDRYLVGDPLRGQETLTREELVERYDFTQFCLSARIP